MLPSEPIRGLVRDLGREHMAALELSVAYAVAGALETRDDGAAAAVDRKPSITRAVRDEDAWRAPLPGWRHKAWRESEHVRKQVPVGDPQRERAGGPIGVSRHCYARRTTA